LVVVRQNLSVGGVLAVALTPDGVGEVHYAANSWRLHRNSSVAIADLANGTKSTLFAADANGNYAPFGDLFNWRDIDAALKSSPESFGHRRAIGRAQDSAKTKLA
jgi:hypothetical protein